MSWPKDEYGCYRHVELVKKSLLFNQYLSVGFPKNRELYAVDKEIFSSNQAHDIAWDNNSSEIKQVLWRVDDEEEFTFGTKLRHKNYYYFEVAILDGEKRRDYK